MPEKKTKEPKWAATPYCFELYITAGQLIDLKGAMREERRLELIQEAKECTEKENAEIAARTDEEWRKQIEHYGRPYEFYKWDEEKREAWRQSEIEKRKAVPPCKWEDYELEEVQFALPAYEVECYRCRGKGSHVNPSIDGNGISAEEWENDWDYEEREAYWNGGYDVSCYECQGRKVVKEIMDECYLSEPQKLLHKLLQDKWKDDAHYDAIEAAERRMGA